jgi:hypothetical protein
MSKLLLLRHIGILDDVLGHIIQILINISIDMLELTINRFYNHLSSIRIRKIVHITRITLVDDSWYCSTCFKRYSYMDITYTKYEETLSANVYYLKQLCSSCWSRYIFFK